jgi:hypothetical protein
MEIHMAKNTNYLTMALTHKKTTTSSGLMLEKNIRKIRIYIYEKNSISEVGFGKKRTREFRG